MPLTLPPFSRTGGSASLCRQRLLKKSLNQRGGWCTAFQIGKTIGLASFHSSSRTSADESGSRVPTISKPVLHSHGHPHDHSKCGHDHSHSNSSSTKTASSSSKSPYANSSSGKPRPPSNSSGGSPPPNFPSPSPKPSTQSNAKRTSTTHAASDYCVDLVR